MYLFLIFFFISFSCLDYYTSTYLEYIPENFYCAYYVQAPVHLYYDVTNLIYYTPPTTFNVSDTVYYVDSTHPYESDAMSANLEQNSDTFQEFNCNLYNIGNR